MIAFPDDLPPVEFWPSADVRLFSDGLWQPAEDGDGDAVECFLAQVYGPELALIDTVAWQPADASRWWLRYGNATYLGEMAIAQANRSNKPVELVGTPKEYLARNGHAVCILEWAADLAAIEGSAVCGFFCRDPKLALHLRDTITERRRAAVRVEVIAA